MSEPPPHLFIVLGATGDLAQRKLLPALYRLSRDGRLGGNHRILAVGRRASLDDGSYRAMARAALAAAGFPGEEPAAWCGDTVSYHALADTSDEAFSGLSARVATLDRDHGLAGNRVWYLALPPGQFEPAIEAVGRSGLSRSAGFTRVVVEKPFGRDLASARALNETLHRFFDEDRIYRIDHYLGKETVRNLLVFRFGNTIFEDLWNRDRIESVQITAAEDLGAGERAGFYESTGAVRDIVQNHIAQVLTLVAMEPPSSFEGSAIRQEKVKVLRAIRPLGEEDVVFGRYTSGRVGGVSVPGYLEEKGVAPESTTETFVAIRFSIENWRWQGVPFFVRAGKRLPAKCTEIAVVFRRPPVCLLEAGGSCPLEQNVLFITLQPDEGFTLLMDVKVPGDSVSVKRIPLDFRYAGELGSLPEAYETLLLDVVEGQQTLFVHSEEVEASWALFDPVVRRPRQVQPYPAGTWGPAAAAELLRRTGHAWEAGIRGLPGRPDA
jgi:glucose-6-phosphate 1-dehydrogenase